MIAFRAVVEVFVQNTHKMKANVVVLLIGTNLTNELAYVHTSFVKNQSPLRGRNVVFGVRHQF